MTLNISFGDLVLKWNIFIPNDFLELKNINRWKKSKIQKISRSLNFDYMFLFKFLMSFQRTYTFEGFYYKSY